MSTDAPLRDICPRSNTRRRLSRLPSIGTGGIRAVEIGGVMFGRPDPRRPGHEKLPDLDLVRLAAPRRVYTNTHLEYVAEVAVGLHRQPQALRGVRIVREAPVLRRFTARLN
jgi:tryptophanase